MSEDRLPTAEQVVKLGVRLKRIREKSGMSLRAVARQLGVSASFLSQLENGKSQPSVATLYSLAQLLDVSIDELFSTDAKHYCTLEEFRASRDTTTWIWNDMRIEHIEPGAAPLAYRLTVGDAMPHSVHSRNGFGNAE